tara:strand:+ start:27066 stop:29390 length:2325 start_codon:yes stop_codon:yes gene_type:complete
MKSISFLATFVAFFFFTDYVNAQEQYKEEELNQMLTEQVNQLRKEHQLPPFELDEILDAAAFDQASFILKAGKVVHTQDQSKKEKLVDRILYYEGLHASAGENAAILGRGSKARIEPKGTSVTIDSDLKIIKAAIASWLEEDEGRLNLLDPDFFRFGSAVLFNEKEEYILVLVMASEPYEQPNNKKPNLNFNGIKPYDKKVCDPFLENNPSLPQLFSDALQVEGDEVFLVYHSLEYMEEVINSSGDAIAVDVIQRNQYDCNGGNKLFPTEINDGYLLPLAKKGLLNTYNTLKEKGEVKLKVGKLPDFYDPNQSELNMVIIKDGYYCETVPYNQLESKNVKWFDVPYLFAGKNDSASMTWNDTTHINLAFDENWKKNLSVAFEKFSWINYEFNSIEIQIKQAPVPNQLSNATIKQMVFEQLPDSNFSFSINQKSTWEDFFQAIKGTYYELETKEMDTSQIKIYLKESIEQDAELQKILATLNSIELKISGVASISQSGTISEKQRLFEWLFEQNKLAATLYLQNELIDAVRRKEFKAAAFPKLDPHQKKENLPLINNQIALADLEGEVNFGGNPIYLAFLELYLINKGLVEISFNRHVSLLKYWSDNKRDIKNFEDWDKTFKLLASRGIKDELYARTLLNYNLIAADYYYDLGNFKGRKSAFDGIMKWQSQSNLNSEEVLDLAQYLVYQDQLSNAIALLLPLTKSSEINQAQLFYLLQIGIYDRESLSEANYFKLMKTAQELFPKDFCGLFSKEKMGIQSLKNSEIKNLYCTHCQ